MTGKRVVLIVLLPGTLMVGFLVFVMALLGGAFEEVCADDGSLKSWLMGIPSEIRGVPRVGVVRNVSFCFSWGDGGAPPFDDISYVTNASIEEVRYTIEGYFLERGYHPNSTYSFADDVSHLGIGVEAECGGCGTQVVVTRFVDARAQSRR